MFALQQKLSKNAAKLEIRKSTWDSELNVGET